MTDIREQNYINAAKNGDGEAFTQLVALYEKKVFSQALWVCGDRRLAEDAAQEAFLSAWQGLPFFRGESAFSTWLYRLTANACNDLLRKEGRQRAASLDELGETVASDGADAPQEQAERSEKRECVRRALARLSAEHREILILREMQELRYDEIARVLSLDAGTVKSRIHRARQALRELLREDGNFSESPASNDTERGREHARV
ncbi:MAG: RNA polymerase sigma factor [Oscillibacter sp.]|nr:RNA polymerase sigma factor [Oscillibacter sp.]